MVKHPCCDSPLLFPSHFHIFSSKKSFFKKHFKTHPIQVKSNWNATSKTCKNMLNNPLHAHFTSFFKWSGIYFKTNSKKSTKWMAKQFSEFFSMWVSATHAFIRLEAQLKGRLHTILQSVANKTKLFEEKFHLKFMKANDSMPLNHQFSLSNFPLSQLFNKM